MSNLSSLINRFHLVRQIPIFAGLSWMDLHKIARKSVISEHKKGDIICRQGEPPDFFYCVVSGRLQAYTTGAGGRKGDVDFIHRGMHFGIVSILTGENHTMTFEVLNDSIILKIAKDDFQTVLTDIPQLGLRLSQSLSKRIRHGKHDVKSVFESTVIAVYSPVQGTGSSTYAVNLALSIQKETKKNVIFINIHANQTQPPAGTGTETPGTGPASDGDVPPSPDKTAEGGTSPRWKTAPVNLDEIVDGHEKILERVIKKELPVDLLNVSFSPNDAALKRRIGLFVSAFVGDYHYVVVDLPNDMDDIVLETLTQADLVHLVTCDRTNDLESIRKVVDHLENALREKFREERVRVVVRPVQDKIYLSFEDINKRLDYRVYAALENLQPAELTQRQDSAHLFFLQTGPHSEYSKTVTRIAREIGGVSVGLALGGGAALGIAHIGVLRVLEKENIPVDIIAGSSMGAIIAGLWAIGKDAAEIEKVARDFEKRKNMMALLDPVVPISGLIGGRAIKYWLRKNFGGRTLYSTRIPLKFIAYDLVRREELVLESGPLVEAIRKSIAIPGVIEPVVEKDRLIIDGGVLNPLPTNVLASRQIKKIIAVNVLQSPHDVCENFALEKDAALKETRIPFSDAPWQFLKIRALRFLLRPLRHNISDIIVRTLQATEYVLAEQSAQQADVVIHPDLVGINWFELYKVEELIKRVEEAARKALPEIKKLVEAE
ncbi:MAG: patatin-like phospholipase family protein [Candidatus Omnitrophica bacterium]|nr:patatin-like phospholipase family protein [Candidatus Omnitrophota bacterium]